MVSKRQPQDLSDSEGGSSPAKRARRDVSDDSAQEATPEPTSKLRKLKGKKKARDDDSDDDDRQVRFQEPLDEEELADLELEEKIRQERLDIIRAEHAETKNKRGVSILVLHIFRRGNIPFCSALVCLGSFKRLI
jgi:hypothetical protein